MVKLVNIGLNQQQLELIDKTVTRGIAADRNALMRKALTEYAAKHPPQGGAEAAERKKEVH